MEMGNFTGWMIAGALVTLGSGQAQAMGHARSSFPAIATGSMVAYDRVPLQATDGSSTSLLSDTWTIAVADPALSQIPEASADADTTLCGRIDPANLAPGTEIQAYLDQTTRVVNLESIAVHLMSSPLPRELSLSDAELIRTTPRCSPFDIAIDMIAQQLGQAPEGHEALRLVASQGLQVVSVQLGNRNGKGLVSLFLANGKVAEFVLADTVSSSVDGVPYHFLDASVTPEQAGQPVGLKIVVQDVQFGQETHFETPSNCHFTESYRVCRGFNSCQDEYVSLPGHTVVSSGASPSVTTYGLVLTGPSGAELARVLFTLNDPGTERPLEGRCVPDYGFGFGHPPARRLF